MPIEHVIDSARGVVFTRATGVLNRESLVAAQQALRDDPAFRPDMRQLLDLRSATALDLPAAQMPLVGRGTAFLPTARRAFVVRSDAGYGLARMYQLSSDRDTEHLQIFRDVDEARRWLGPDLVDAG